MKNIFTRRNVPQVFAKNCLNMSSMKRSAWDAGNAKGIALKMPLKVKRKLFTRLAVKNALNVEFVLLYVHLMP
jgi:hypothetical protein